MKKQVIALFYNLSVFKLKHKHTHVTHLCYLLHILSIKYVSVCVYEDIFLSTKSTKLMGRQRNKYMNFQRNNIRKCTTIIYERNVEKFGIKNVASVVRESLNSVGQQFYQYQHNKQSSLISNHRTQKDYNIWRSKSRLGTVGQEQKITHCRNISKIL